MYRIRRARPGERDDIVDMDNACFTEDDQVDARKGVWWVAEAAGGTLAGFAGGYVWKQDRALVLHRCGVLRKHRGQGLQRRLLRARIAYAKREGLDAVLTYTTHYNVVSSNNLIREGFTLWEPAHWGGSTDPMKPTAGYAWLYWKRKVSE